MRERGREGLERQTRGGTEKRMSLLIMLTKQTLIVIAGFAYFQSTESKH